jgi:hypothetical protein
MRNISALSAALILGLVLSPALWATSAESLKQAVVQAYEESSMPVFDPEIADQTSKKEKNKVLDKIQRRRAEFYRKERERKRDFILKIRNKTEWSDEKRQQEIVEYHKKEQERLEKFLKKQQKQIEKQHEFINI